MKRPSDLIAALRADLITLSAAITTASNPDEYDAAQAAHCEVSDRIEAISVTWGRNPDKGDMVEVTRGRKVPLGTVGWICWIGESSYGPRNRREFRVGLSVPGQSGLVYTSYNNVDLVIPDPEEIAERRRSVAEWKAANPLPKRIY